MLAVVSLILMAASEGTTVVSWDFTHPAEAAAWEPNGGVLNKACADGLLTWDAHGSDPFFTCEGFEFPATPWQCVLIRIRADKAGACELFWTGTSEGRYGGFSQNKTTDFKMKGTGEWEEIALLPFWHTEKTIRKFRFDMYGDAHFELDSIRVISREGGEVPVTDQYSWAAAAGQLTQMHAVVPGLFAPPLRLDTAGKDWAAVRMRADKDGTGHVLWADADGRHLNTEPFAFCGGEEATYNVELGGLKGWGGEIVAFGVRVPDRPETGAKVMSLAIGERPEGPPEVKLMRFGFENAINRAERSCTIVAELVNAGGDPAAPGPMELVLPDGVVLEGSPAHVVVPALDSGQRHTAVWRVRASRAGVFPLRLTFSGEDAPEERAEPLRFLPAMPVVKADYVPGPQPIETDTEILAYYFPGWGSDVKWDPIRFTAPTRKPLLGYYDEGNPECVDWQIKWAVENGISCFLVDWYWIQGSQHLTHWFEAYRECKYRDMLQVAIMWANHNPPNTHSVEDWRAVTKEWIDKYFNLPGYYRIDGKPAVFIWSPDGILRDIGSSEAVRAMLDESQETAKAAGYEGITYVAMRYRMTAETSARLEKEGYTAFTTYHEWGDAQALSSVPRRAQYSDVAATTRKAWEGHEAIAGSLTYFPVADTGWDSRPWHGPRGLAIEGRTPELFEDILRQAKEFARSHGNRPVVLAPLNEWGEGSYIEPCTEFGFQMYEAIRKVFGKGDPASWPVNLAPEDVGRGPYEFPAQETRTQWNFGQHLGGWQRQMGVDALRCEGGAMRFRTVTDDPAITTRTLGVRAEQFSKLRVRMQFPNGLKAGDAAQLFWTTVGKAATEATSVRFGLSSDTEMHTYEVSLSDNPRWRGDITSIRFDPCSEKDVEVLIDEIAFVETPPGS